MIYETFQRIWNKCYKAGSISFEMAKAEQYFPIFEQEVVAEVLVTKGLNTRDTIGYNIYRPRGLLAVYETCRRRFAN